MTKKNSLITEGVARVEDICAELFGPPVREGKGGTKFRPNGNLSVDFETGLWNTFDGSGAGGYYPGHLYGLIAHGLGVDKADTAACTHWLKDFLGKPQRPTQPNKRPNPARESKTNPALFPHKEGCVGGEAFTRVSYPYTDANGKVAYIKQRKQCLECGAKQIFFAHLKNGKFTPGKGEAKSLPYRLDSWFTSANPIVFLCEGEKTADALALVKGVQTTSVDNWTPEIIEFFRGMEVVIIRDFDEPGLRKAEAAVQALTSVAYSISYDAAYEQQRLDWDNSVCGMDSPFWQTEAA
jgi:hypothetical protein